MAVTSFSSLRFQVMRLYCYSFAKLSLLRYVLYIYCIFRLLASVSLTKDRKLTRSCYLCLCPPFQLLNRLISFQKTSYDCVCHWKQLHPRNFQFPKQEVITCLSRDDLRRELREFYCRLCSVFKLGVCMVICLLKCANYVSSDT